MQTFDIVKRLSPKMTFRTKSIVDAFDLDVNHIDEHFKGEIDIDGRSWNVGLIVGGSGTGKSTIAREIFGDCIFSEFKSGDGAVIDDMPQSVSVKEIEKAFTSVGFASPPSWLKPYNVLSNGEKMRVQLAYCLLSGKSPFCFDEFTSVVNREVAKTTSVAIAKATRKANKQFIDVSCHDDIVNWLEPDWVYNTDEHRFFFAQVKSNDPRCNLTYMKWGAKIKKTCGVFFESITI